MLGNCVFFIKGLKLDLEYSAAQHFLNTSRAESRKILNNICKKQQNKQEALDIWPENVCP